LQRKRRYRKQLSKMLTDSELDVACDTLVEHEGLVPWLYCDSKGYVTVGVGDKVSLDGVATMPFVRRSDGSHADSEAKRAAWESVHGRPGFKAGAYTALSDLRLPVEYCRRRLVARVKDEFVPAVEKHCPQFASFPPKAKLVLVDICYNVGVAGFAQFLTLIGLCNVFQFAKAAEHVHTKKEGEDPHNPATWGRRNTWRRISMVQAATDGQP
jgi:GH24 family phage-related lysozyme (muramidase)